MWPLPCSRICRPANFEQGPSTAQVYGNDIIKLLGAHFQQRSVPDDARIIHQQIDATVGLHAGADQSLAVRHLGDGADVGRNLAASLTDQPLGFCQRFGIGPVDDHRCAIRGEPTGKCPAQSPRRSGDHGPQSIE